MPGYRLTAIPASPATSPMCASTAGTNACWSSRSSTARNISTAWSRCSLAEGSARRGRLFPLPAKRGEGATEIAAPSPPHQLRIYSRDRVRRSQRVTLLFLQPKQHVAVLDAATLVAERLEAKFTGGLKDLQPRSGDDGRS